MAVIVWARLPGEPDPTRDFLAMPYLHTFGYGPEVLHLPGGDPDVPWTGDPSSIRALGRAATGAAAHDRQRALDRIRRMGRKSARYLAAVRASEPFERGLVRIGKAELRDYARDACSFERQQAQFLADGVHPRWSLRARWRALVPNGGYFGSNRLGLALRDHDRLHDSPDLEPVAVAAMRDDPSWVEFRRQAKAICQHLDSTGATS